MSDQAQATAAPVAPVESSNQQQSTQEAALNNLTSAPGQASPQEVKAEIKRIKQLKLKVNGRDVVENLPFEIPETPEAIEYATKHLQLSKMGQAKAQQYDTLEKEVGKFIEELRKNPRKILSDPSIGLDVKQFAAKILEEEIENSKKSPEQLEKEKLQAELNAAKEEKERLAQEYQQKEFERLQEQAYNQYEASISKAIETTDLPKSPYIVKKIADYMLLGLQNNLDVTAEDVLPLVRQEMQADLKEMFAVMPEDVIEALVGKDVITRLRKKSIAKAKTQSPAPVKSSSNPLSLKPEVKSTGKKMTIKDLFGI